MPPRFHRRLYGSAHWVNAALLLFLLLPACAAPSRPASPAPTAASIFPPTSTASVTPSASPHPTVALTPTPSPIIPSSTYTPAPSWTPSPTSSPTASPSLTPTPAVPQRPWRIMPLGDSLTSGSYPGSVHSYRGYLEMLLKDAGYPVDFVGSQSRPAHGGEDPDHEGYSGYTIGPDLSRFCSECETANLYDHLERSLQSEPDIILLLIGVNDMFPLDVRPVDPFEAADKLERLVQRIVALRPGVQLFVASLAPVQWTDGRDWSAYQAVNAAAERVGQAHPADQIFFVDLNRQLEARFDKSVDFADSVHWNENGARKVAQVWYEALVDSGLLLSPPP